MNSLFVLLGPLLLFGCIERGELIDAGPDMSFGISLTVDKNIAAQFAPVRVVVEERGVAKDGGDGQLGYTMVSPVVGTRNYRITLPESYQGKLYKGMAADFIVEFRKINSALDDIPALQSIPVALNLLKSRYWGTTSVIPDPSDIEPLKITVDSAGTLSQGYGPGGLKLTDIPNVPPIYLIELNPDDDVKEFDFEYSGGLAVVYEADQYPPFDELIAILRDTPNIYGLTSPMLDWYLIMLPDVYKEGTPFSLFLYAKPQGKCPCGDTCSCSILCPYKNMLNDKFGLGYYPVHIQIDEAQAASLNIGDTITINLTLDDFMSCDELIAYIPTTPVPLPPISLPSLPDGILESSTEP